MSSLMPNSGTNFANDNSTTNGSSSSSSYGVSNSSNNKVDFSIFKTSDIQLTHDDNFVTCTGKITNNGTKYYAFIKLRGAFVNAAGQELDVGLAYGAGPAGLAPGESNTFEVGVKYDSGITNCLVEAEGCQIPSN